MSYKFLIVGNDTLGAVKFFRHNQMKQAEAFANQASEQFRQALGVKRGELAEDQVIAMINSNIALMMARTLRVKHDA
jgi:hypothetical protein